MRIYLEGYLNIALGFTEKTEHEVEDSLTIGELLDKFGDKQYIVLVNGSYQPHSYVLNPGDVVTLLLTLSGG